MGKSDMLNYNLPVAYSLGRETNLAKARRIEETWGKMVDRFRAPTKTQETFAEYHQMSDAAQKALKSSAGWFLRTTVDKATRNKDSVQPGNIITLDLDYPTEAFFDKLEAGKVLPGTLLFWHTTRSHTPEKPKVRMVIRAKQRIGRDKYGPVVRILAQKIGIDFIDKVSARSAQMMFLPTVSKDMERHYGFHEQEGEPLDVKELLSKWEADNGSSDNYSLLPLFPGEGNLRKPKERMEDPLEKEGEVGNFCRAWSITELINGKTDENGKHTPGPLEGIYEITDYNQSSGAGTRATYLGGTSSHGAVIYEDKFLYSHHGSDPVQEQEVNAYDLVRIHLFGDKDKLDHEDLPIGQRPSTKDMREWLKTDPFYKAEQINSRYDFDAMFDDAGIEPEPDTEEDSEQGEEESESEYYLRMEDSIYADEKPARIQAERPPKNWIAAQLTTTQQGDIQSNAYNIAAIITNDPRFWRKVAMNAFTGNPVILDDIPTKNKLIQPLKCHDKVNGDPWIAHYDNTLHAILSSPRGPGNSGYGLKAAEGDLFKGVKIAAGNNEFHPILEFLKKCNEAHPDKGVDHIRDFPAKFLGVADDEYHRTAFANMLIGSVARIHEPGCKFDNMLVLLGPQGAGKSSLIEMLYGEYYGVMDADLHDRRSAAEQTMGKWGMEMAELANLKKSESESAKAFLSRTDDTVRLAYDRSNTVIRRRTIFWGTGNVDMPLRDRTGNRRYWIFRMGVKKLDFKAVEKIIPAMWAQAYREYLALRASVPVGRDIDFSLRGEALAEAERLQEGARTAEAAEQWADVVEEWFDKPINVSEIAAYFNDRVDPYEYVGGAPDNWQKGWPAHDMKVHRLGATVTDILEHALGFRKGAIPSGQNLTWTDCRNVLRKRGWLFSSRKPGGDLVSPSLGSAWGAGAARKPWVLPPDWDQHDPSWGYRLVAEAQDPESGGAPEVDDNDLI